MSTASKGRTHGCTDQCCKSVVRMVREHAGSDVNLNSLFPEGNKKYFAALQQALGDSPTKSLLEQSQGFGI
jgi:hypothetical protein